MDLLIAVVISNLNFYATKKTSGNEHYNCHTWLATTASITPSQVQNPERSEALSRTGILLSVNVSKQARYISAIRAGRGAPPSRPHRHRTGRPAIFCRQLFPEGWKDRWDKTVTMLPICVQDGTATPADLEMEVGVGGANGRQKGCLDGI